MIPFELVIILEPPEFHEPEHVEPLEEVCRLLRPLLLLLLPLLLVLIVDVVKLILPEADGGGVGGVIIGVVPLLLAVESSYKPSLPLLLDALVVGVAVVVVVVVVIVLDVVVTETVVTLDVGDEVEVNWLKSLELE